MWQEKSADVRAREGSDLVWLGTKEPRSNDASGAVGAFQPMIGLRCHLNDRGIAP